MKNLKFNNTASILRINPEEKPKKRFNWDRLVYISLVVLLLGSLAYYFVNQLLYVHAQGLVLTENITVQYPYDVKVVTMKVKESQVVKQGDTLFKVMKSVDYKPTNNTQATNNNANWIEHEKSTAEKSILLNNIALGNVLKLIESSEKDAKRIEEEVSLGIYTANKSTEINSSLNNLRMQADKLSNENSYLRNYIQSLGSGASENAPIIPQSYRTDSVASLTESYLSPVNGTITNTYKNDFETALRGQPLITIADNNQTYIQGYFDQKDMDNVHEKDIVTIRFPNGEISRGYIDKINFTTKAMPEVLQNKYSSNARTVSANIKPLNKEEAVWKIYYKLAVDIKKKKYF